MMATTLDEEFRKTLKDHAAGASGVSEGYALASIRAVSINMDGDDEIWTLTAAEAEKRARKYRLIAAYALRGAVVCENHASAHAIPDLATAIESVRAVLHVE